MIAIELAFEKGWKNLWLECDSVLVTKAFKSPNLVPLKLRNRWENCMNLRNGMNFVCTHIYREGNTCADKLACHGTIIQGYLWWDLIPNFIREDFFRNRYGMPNYRFK